VTDPVWQFPPTFERARDAGPAHILTHRGVTRDSPRQPQTYSLLRGNQGFMRMKKVFSGASSLTPKGSIAECASYIGQKG
jgi:hypothetical protein